MKYDFSKEVAAGIDYLDRTYGNWWEKVDVAKLNIYSPTDHVVSQIRGECYYDTPEFARGQDGWQYGYGFDADSSTSDWDSLNLEWMLRVRELQIERATNDAKEAGE